MDLENEIIAHYSRYDTLQARALIETLQALHQALPGATKKFSWGMPTIAIGPTPALSVEGFGKHNSVFPGPDVIARLGSLLDNHVVTKGTIHFERDQPMERRLVKAIAKAAVLSINARYPKADGTLLEFYDNGWLKQSGKYRDGKMHGAWSWYRRDGSLMRTGHFQAGEPTGLWQTFVREGQVHTTKTVPERR